VCITIELLETPCSDAAALLAPLTFFLMKISGVALSRGARKAAAAADKEGERRGGGGFDRYPVSFAVPPVLACLLEASD